MWWGSIRWENNIRDIFLKIESLNNGRVKIWKCGKIIFLLYQIQWLIIGQIILRSRWGIAKQNNTSLKKTHLIRKIGQINY